MSKVTAATVRVAYIVEVTPGTTPTSPAFTIFRATGESLDVQRKLVFSSELNGKRGEKNGALASKTGGGGFNFEFTDGTLEDFLESAMRGAWASDVLVDADTPKHFTLEAFYESGTTDIYKRLLGAHVDQLSLNLRATEILTGNVNFKALNSDFYNALLSSATYNAGNSEPILVGADFGTLTMSGLTLNGLTNLDITIANNLREQMVLGSLTPAGLGAGKFEVTGSIGMFLDSAQLSVLSAYSAGTATSLNFEIGKTAAKCTYFELPNVLLSDMKVNAESAEGDVMLTANFRALQATGISNSVLRVTRNSDVGA